MTESLIFINLFEAYVISFLIVKSFLVGGDLWLLATGFLSEV